MFASAVVQDVQADAVELERLRHAGAPIVRTSTPLGWTTSSVAVEDERRRVRLLDHRRAVEHGAGRERFAAVDRAVHRPVGVEPDLAQARLGRSAALRATRRTGRLGSERRHAEVDQLDRLAGKAEAVLALVLAFEPLEQLPPTLVVEVAVGKRDLELVVLSGVAEVGRPAHVAPRRRRRCAAAPSTVVLAQPPLGARHVVESARGPNARRTSARGRPVPAVIAAPRAEQSPGCGGTSTVRHVEPLRDRSGVQRAGAAEGDQREVARVEAALDGDQPDRVRHVLVGGPHRRDAAAASADRSSASPSPASAARAASSVERHRPAEEVRRVEPAERQVRVGQRRLGPALPVGDRAPARRRRSGGRRAAGRPCRSTRSSRRRRRSCCTATHGMLTGIPHATWNSAAYCSFPSRTRPMSQLVPPMSSEKTDG